MSRIHRKIPHVQVPKLKWDSMYITQTEEKRIINTILNLQNDYSYFDSARINKLKTALKKILPNKPWFKEMHAMSLRRSYLRNRVMCLHHNILMQKSKIKEEYDAGTSILDIAKQYKFSPVATFRILLQARGITSKEKLKKMTKNPQDYLGERDQKELASAIEHDIISMPDHTPIIEAAEGYELDLESLFKQHTKNYKTQQHLVDHQRETIGELIATPDLYFPNGVIINGKKLYWIDAKNFYGADTNNIRSGLKKQAKRYNQLYGQGAFIFKYSFSLSLRKNFLLNHPKWEQRALLLSWDGRG